MQVKHLALALGVVGVAGCGGSERLAVFGPGYDSGVPVRGIAIAMTVEPSGTYVADINTVEHHSESGGFPSVTLYTGVNKLAGTYSGGALVIRFGVTAQATGGITPGFFELRGGIVLERSRCTVTFVPGEGTQSFDFRFSVTTDLRSACQ